MNYFSLNGYQMAAEAFCKEAKAKPDMPLQSIGKRKKIREAILKGDMQQATELINSIDPQILIENAEINFRLKQQQLLQLIEKKGESTAAVEFAQKQLAPCVKQNPELLPQLEETMLLLAFDDIKCQEAQNMLGEIEQREKAAQRIDEVILDFFNIDQELILETLTKNLLCTQPMLHGKANCCVPLLSDISLGSMQCLSGNELGSTDDIDSIDCWEESDETKDFSSPHWEEPDNAAEMIVESIS
ncbi:LisH protein [Cardiosporidium cionae]|uniref:LisH protein n=1 Tax=Cardiosporidium cionae TaxID=476202 RepID=A0ABQ7J5Q1_9APIC|nr:LisH protein [Cardiosporidium cionae]|eukprot:KAF8819335.1 LisH protein [Cardiosporidium cionae]